MSDGVNKAILVGNLGSDPELRMTNGGQACLTMRLATSRTYLDRNQQRQQDTQWHRVIVWGKSAEGLGKFLSKGMRLYVEGRIQYREYEDRDGNRKFTTEIVAESTVVLTEKRGGSREREPSDASFDYGKNDKSGEPDDDIPW